MGKNVKVDFEMTTTLRTLLSELDRPDLPDAAKQVVQLEIEKLLGRNAREILRVMETVNPEREIKEEDLPTMEDIHAFWKK